MSQNDSAKTAECKAAGWYLSWLHYLTGNDSEMPLLVSQITPKCSASRRFHNVTSLSAIQEVTFIEPPQDDFHEKKIKKHFYQFSRAGIENELNLDGIQKKKK